MELNPDALQLPTFILNTTRCNASKRQVLSLFCLESVFQGCDIFVTHKKII